MKVMKAKVWVCCEGVRCHGEAAASAGSEAGDFAAESSHSTDLDTLDLGLDAATRVMPRLFSD